MGVARLGYFETAVAGWIERPRRPNDMARIAALRPQPVRLHSYRVHVLLWWAHLPSGRGADKFLPIVLGHELGFLIAKSRFESRGRERERR